jgi:predicted GNAT family acetyltransferase
LQRPSSTPIPKGSGGKLGGMDVHLIKEPQEFAEIAGPYLESDAFSTNVIGVHLGGVLGGSRPKGSEDLWVAVVDDGRVVGVGVHTPPRHLFLSRMSAAATASIAKALSKVSRRLPGVNGEASAVTWFADAWTALADQTSITETRMRMYRLGRLAAPTGVPGTARLAGSQDAELVTDWFNAFLHETAPDHPVDDTDDQVQRRLLAGQLWLWIENGQPVSLAAHSAPAVGVARVGPVYTRDPHRGHGYGAAVTAKTTQAALDAGADHVVLYTDLANPTSNSIYQAIGYVADHDAEERRFDNPATTRPSLRRRNGATGSNQRRPNYDPTPAVLQQE